MSPVVPYDPGWFVEFERARGLLSQALGASAIDIEHIGSTAVPGLPAKPIIDVAVLVPSMELSEAALLRARNVAGLQPTAPARSSTRLFRPEGRYGQLKTSLYEEGICGRKYTAAKTALIQELTNAERAQRGLTAVDVWEK